jgi:endoglucanase
MTVGFQEIESVKRETWNRMSRMKLGIAVLTVFVTAVTSAADSASLAIKVDQVGYPTAAPKLAMVATQASTFMVKRAGDGTVVLNGKLSAAVSDADSGDRVQLADFSSLREPGKYYLEVPGVGRSWTFSIGPDVFSRTYYLGMRAFYGQRCGTAVDLGPEFPGYSHPACHLQSAFHPSSGKQGPSDIRGGWHDAGDYGRYIPNSGITTSTLMWTWEMFGARLKGIKLNLPESGNGTPDILNEARWNLEWMLKMQDEDGGVWQKQTSEKFPGFVMPQADQRVNEIIGTGSAPYKSTCATADLAATAAIAARVYKPFDEKFAARALDAARKAWSWAERNPSVLFRNPPGVATGEYGDAQCSDERLWAAAELWRTTGEPAYNRYFLQNYETYLPSLRSSPPENWAQLASLGLWTYALADTKGADAHAAARIRQETIESARTVVKRTQTNPYRVSLTARDYVWGSNSVAAGYGMELIVANAFAPDPGFVETALDNLHYLLGRNAFSLSWVTQVGEHTFRHPHHRPSGADKNPEPWPGLLSGGPNAHRQDDVLKSLPELPPAKVYRDEQDSYAGNEIAINWQASFVFLVAAQLP